jgi:nucleoid DNA-binding protein
VVGIVSRGMTKQELVSRLASHPEAQKLSRAQVALLVDAVFANLADFFVGARVSRRAPPRFCYPGFGTFIKKVRGARNGRHPRTGQPIEIPEAVTLAFQPGQELKVRLNGTPRRRARGG